MVRVFVLVLLSFQSLAFDFTDVPASGSIEEAKLRMKVKKEKIIEDFAKREVTKFPFHLGFRDANYDTLSAVVAKVVSGHDLEAVNKYLLDERLKPGIPGTRITLAMGICKRYGDYDFVLQELLRIAYLGKDKISAEARGRLYNTLLNQKGNKHYRKFRICGINKVDTENHILMTETARYLTNQIFLDETGEEQYDNEKNGFNLWLINHLADLAEHGFSEINSKPYAGYTISTLFNLYDFARDERVRNNAKVLLDYLNMKYAMESIGNRRYPMIRRKKMHYNHQRLDHHDPHNTMAMLWFGNYDYLFDGKERTEPSVEPYIYRFAFNASITTYVPEDIIYDHIFNPAESSNQNYGHEHGVTQLVVKTPELVFSGGGSHQKMWPSITRDNDIHATPAMIIPAMGRERSEVIYFLGQNKITRRNNNCVKEGFICGVNLHLPKSFDECPNKQMGDWSFYDLSQCRGTRYSGYYLAAYKKNLRRSRSGKDYGFVEIVKANGDFESFTTSILSSNPTYFKRFSEVTYTKSNGEKIDFVIQPKKHGSLNFSIPERRVRVEGSHHLMDDYRMVIYSPDQSWYKNYTILRD